MESSITKWASFLPSSCLITGRQKIRAFHQAKREVSRGLMNRLNLYFPSINHSDDVPPVETLLLQTVLYRSPSIDTDLLCTIHGNGAHGRSFMDRLHDSWDVATVDLLPCPLLNRVERSSAAAKKHDEKMRNIVLCRTQFAARGREAFIRLHTSPLPLGISKHNSTNIWLQMTTLDSQSPNLIGAADLLRQNIFHQFAKSNDQYPLDCKFKYASKQDVYTAVNAPDMLGRTPLYVACESNASMSFIKKLIYWGADPKLSKWDCGLTVLHFSAALGHSDPSKALLGRSANLVWMCDNWQRLPIFYAAMNGHHHLVEYLLNSMWEAPLDNGWNANKTKGWILHRDCEGRTFFCWAAAGGHQQFIEAAIQWADAWELRTEALHFLNIQDKEGLTAIGWAVKNNHLSTAAYLRMLEKKAAEWRALDRTFLS
jgi:hypothetical protein